RNLIKSTLKPCSILSQKIVRKEMLAKDCFLYEIDAPGIARKYMPGQFLVIRIDEKGERIPLTIADTSENTITMVFQAVGKSTRQLARLEVGDSILDVVGPLGKPEEVRKYGKVVLVGGGTGAACLLPIAKALRQHGNRLEIILGSRTADLLILEKELGLVASLRIATDDGSKGHKGFVTDLLKQIIAEAKPDKVIAIGPPVMMKAVCEITRGIPTDVSLNPIMLDATGMCGSCRVEVAGEIRLACIDGPMFDGHKVNFDDLISRLQMYKEKELHAIDHEKCYE
ncbi:MAG: sulfide/dihydroorotate dehydrogenase-like FAD/NAD-binding protein, partial [Candidatus Woesearchaeota archaeon]